MSGERFTLDTNVLVYAFDVREPARQSRALTVLEAAVRLDCVLTLQALGEFFAVVTRKGMLDRRDAVAQIRDWRTLFPTVAADPAALDHALRAVEEGKLSYWDALLIATAAGAGCSTVLSEDMGPGPHLGGVTVLNPFAVAEPWPAVAALLGLS